MRRRFMLFVTLAVVCAVCASCTRYVYYPSRSVYRTPGDAGMTYLDLTLTAADGVRISAWYIPAIGAKNTILFCHGNAGNMSDNLQTVKLLRSLNYNVLIFDYRGYGKSEGNPNAKGTYLDALAAWDYLTVGRGDDPRTIAVHGRSLGGAVASYLAAERDPGALILESAFTSMGDMANKVTGTPLSSSMVAVGGVNYDTIANCRKVKCPTLVIHSRQDEVVPYEMGRRLYEAIPVTDKEFLEISGSHNSGWADSARAYANGIQSFLARALPDAASGRE